MSQTEEHIQVYSDYVCPFCYLGRRSLERYLETREDQIAIEWHPFDLRRGKRGPDGEIDHSVEDGKDEAYYDQVRENVARLREEYGTEEMLSLEDLPEAVDSFDAQVAAVYVKAEYPDRWLAFHEGIFEALWIEGRNIGDVDVLADLAGDVGIPGEAVRAAVADGESRERLESAFAEADRDGITAVPTFTYEGHAARGAVPPEQLERLVEGP
jgi:predicted DsbA family dithiol-disulfide isomerase